MARVDPTRALELLDSVRVNEPASDTGSADVTRSHILAEFLNNPQEGLLVAQSVINRSAANTYLRFAAHMSAANCLRLLGRHEEALLHCDAAAQISLQPWQSDDRHLIFLNRAMALIDLGCVEEALVLADESRRFHPTEARLDLLIGTRLMMKGEHNRAEPFLRRPAELNPGDLSSVVNYASCLVQLNRASEALQWLDIAYELAPGDADVLMLFVQVYGKAGDVFRSAEVLSDAIQSDPKNEFLREWGQWIVDVGWRKTVRPGHGFREAYRAIRAFQRLQQVLNDNARTTD